MFSIHAKFNEVCGAAIFVTVAVLASTLWVIYGIIRLYNYIVNRITGKTTKDELLQNIEEFIFAGYGFGALFLILPISVIDDDNLL